MALPDENIGLGIERRRFSACCFGLVAFRVRPRGSGVLACPILVLVSAQRRDGQPDFGAGPLARKCARADSGAGAPQQSSGGPDSAVAAVRWSSTQPTSGGRHGFSNTFNTLRGADTDL